MRAALTDRANHIVTREGSGDWTTHEVTAPIPDDANTVAFGLFLAGPGRIELRTPELTRDGPALLTPGTSASPTMTLLRTSSNSLPAAALITQFRAFKLLSYLGNLVPQP